MSNPPNSYRTQLNNQTATADDEGRFTIYMQPEDRFGIYLEHPQGIGWAKYDDFREGKEIRLHGFAEKLDVVLPKSLAAVKDVWINLMHSELGCDGFGHIDYQEQFRPSMKTVSFEGLVAGKYTINLNVPNPEHLWVRGSGSQGMLSQQFEISVGETQTLDLNQSGTTVTGRITLPSSVEERFAARDWTYNYVSLFTPGSDDEKTERKVSLTQSPVDPQTGMFRFENVPEGTWFLKAEICKAPKNSDKSDEFTPILANYFSEAVNLPKQDKPFDVGPLPQLKTGK